LDPLVSVVIPTLPKRKKLLERAVQSVNNQTYKNIEILPITDGNNACEARNIGINKAKGKYIAFLDDDDTWEPTKIEKQVQYLEKHDTCVLIIHWSHDLRVGEGRINKPPSTVGFKELLKGFQLSSTSSYMVHRSVLKLIEKFYGYIYDESFPSGQEYDLALRISKIFGEIHCIPEVLMTQYKTPGQISENWGNKIRTQFLFMSKWGKYYTPIDYCKRLGVASLFFMGFFLGDKVMYPINFMKQRFET
jgi:glycosyltransferase involved in cell wall biosynthesis